MSDLPDIDSLPAGPVVVLLSGGVDSTTLLHAVASRVGGGCVHALSFAYGQKHSRELEAARWQAAAAGVATHRVVDMGFLAGLIAGKSELVAGGADVSDLSDLSDGERRHPPTYVPNRNMILLSVAAAHAEGVRAEVVFYGAQLRDEYGYWDCTTDFVSRINDVLALNRGTAVQVRAPFAALPKADVVRIGLDLGLDYAHTWSCYRGGEVHCGTCPTCVERRTAFEANGIELDVWPAG